MTEIVLVSGWNEELKTFTHAMYNQHTNEIGVIGGTEEFNFETFVRIMIHEEHHRILHNLISLEVCKALDNIEDTDNLLFDEMNLNLEGGKKDEKK